MCELQPHLMSHQRGHHLVLPAASVKWHLAVSFAYWRQAIRRQSQLPGSLPSSWSCLPSLFTSLCSHTSSLPCTPDGGVCNQSPTLPACLPAPLSTCSDVPPVQLRICFLGEAFSDRQHSPSCPWPPPPPPAHRVQIPTLCTPMPCLPGPQAVCSYHTDSTK